MFDFDLGKVQTNMNDTQFTSLINAIQSGGGDASNIRYKDTTVESALDDLNLGLTEKLNKSNFASVTIDLSTGSGTASFPSGFSKDNAIIIGHRDRNKYGVWWGNYNAGVTVVVNGDNSNIQATSTGNFSGTYNNIKAQTIVYLMKF